MKYIEIKSKLEKYIQERNPVMFCPKIGEECVGDECIAFKRGVMFTLPDASILINKVLGKDFPLANIPLCILLDLGMCTEYDRIIDDNGLVKEVNELIND